MVHRGSCTPGPHPSPLPVGEGTGLQWCIADAPNGYVIISNEESDGDSGTSRRDVASLYQTSRGEDVNFSTTGGIVDVSPYSLVAETTRNNDLRRVPRQAVEKFTSSEREEYRLRKMWDSMGLAIVAAI